MDWNSSLPLSSSFLVAWFSIYSQGRQEFPFPIPKHLFKYKTSFFNWNLIQLEDFLSLYFPSFIEFSFPSWMIKSARTPTQFTIHWLLFTCTFNLRGYCSRGLLFIRMAMRIPCSFLFSFYFLLFLDLLSLSLCFLFFFTFLFYSIV